LLPELAVVVGGPEVTKDNPWCVASPGVDLGVVGEGEATLSGLVSWILGEGPEGLERIAGLAIPERSLEPARGRPLPLEGEPRVVFTEARPAIELASVPSPYLSGAISPDFDRAISVETLRGCPFKCSFCYYYKQFAKVNAFPKGWLQAHFDYAREHGVRELFFLDPTLNARARFSEFLDEVVRANEDGELELHAELVADMVDEKIADKLARANVKGVECGLQSANPKALAAVNRVADFARFERGVSLMGARGIVVKTDLIIGLPEDDEASVRRSIEWVRERKLDASIQVFHLMVLPGTELREKADELGYERLRRPPYYATRSRWMDEDAMRRLIEHASRVFEVEFDPPARALLGAATASDAARAAGEGAPLPYWSKATFEPRLFSTDESAREAGRAAKETAANAMTVVVRSQDLGRDARRAGAFLSEIARGNPHATIDVVVDAPGPFPISLLAELKEAAGTPLAYKNGYDRFQGSEGTLVSTRVSVLANADTSLDSAFLEELERVVPLTHMKTAQSFSELSDFLDAMDGRSVALDRAGALGEAPRDEVLSRLRERLRDDPDSLYFLSREDARAWDEGARGQTPEDAPPEIELPARAVAALGTEAVWR
ncbi:radical SAM protein, partial [bacterium]|nr:radical SAM protein [bacterium]